VASPKQPVLIDKLLHKQLKAKLNGSDQTMALVMSRLVEMFIKGEVVVILPEKRI
jgi:small nuclear ribonucleoprotein (snRNP)-like protein